MAFKRATWHSGLNYQQVCRQCHTEITYTDHSLDFRPWYADGFIYCPKCHTPLRHSEDYAIDGGKTPAPVTVAAPAAPTVPAAPATPAESVFCPACGKPFGANDRFCAGCGTKRT